MEAKTDGALMKSVTRWRVFTHRDKRICEGRLYGVGRSIINGAPVLMFERVWLVNIVEEKLEDGGYVIDAENGRFELHGTPPEFEVRKSREGLKLEKE